MAWEDMLEQPTPEGESLTEHDLDRFRVDGPHAADDLQVLLLEVDQLLGDRAARLVVKTKSCAVTGTPSLQRASGRMWYVMVNGGVVVKSARVTRSGRYLKPGPTSNAPRRASRMMLPGSTLSPHFRR